MLIHGAILSLIAGLAIAMGGWLASLQLFKSTKLRHEFMHMMTAFGGGALISAIAFVLIPEGAHKQPEISTLITFLAGGIFFMAVDRAISRTGGKAGQFLAMMLDFVPEAIVLGAVITQNFAQAAFLTLVIAAQNLPEGYMAYKDMHQKNGSSKKLLCMFFAVGMTGPIYMLLGAYVFRHYDTVLGMLMTFCAGGILYLVFEDVAPHVRMKNHWLPPLGTVLGFMVGLASFLTSRLLTSTQR